MTDLSITAASVVAGANATKIQGICGETILAGQAVVRDTTTRKFMKSDVDGASGLRGCDGIALNGGAVNQPLTIQTAGDITIGATVAIGTVYVVSDTAGGIMPAADADQGDYTIILGIASTAAVIKLAIQAGGAAVP